MPYLLDVQSDPIADLGTRVVVPLCQASAMKGEILRIRTPVFESEDLHSLMMTPQLAGIPGKSLGAKIADLPAQRDQISAALDLLITGI